MSIFKIHKRENPFVQIDKTSIMDARLSFKAKGILAYLLSRPPNWQVYEIEIIKHAKDGRDSVRSGIKELIDCGYIDRKESRNEKGQFKGYEYSVYETPNRDGLSNIGKSNIGESNTSNKELSNKELNNKDKRYPIDSNGDSLLSFYDSKFKEKFGKEHPTVRKEQLEDIKNKLELLIIEYDMVDEEIKEYIDLHFKKLAEGNDGKVFGFLGSIDGGSSPILRYRDEVEFILDK